MGSLARVVGNAGEGEAMRALYRWAVLCGWGIWLGAAYASEDCATQSAHVPVAQQARVLQSCLEKSNASQAERVRQSKSAICEQNARNKGLPLDAQTKYVAECLKRDDVAVAKAKLETQQKMQPSPFKTFVAGLGQFGSTEPPPLDAVGQECLERAQKQKISAHDAKQFRARCEKEIALKQAKEARLSALRREREQRELDLKIEKEQKALAALREREEKTATKQKTDKAAVLPRVSDPVDRGAVSAEQEKQADWARYKIAGDELSSGKVESAVWYKAFSESNGDEKATQAAYIRLRVEQLKALGQTQPSEW